jgi:hypothetical protein
MLPITLHGIVITPISQPHCPVMTELGHTGERLNCDCSTTWQRFAGSAETCNHEGKCLIIRFKEAREEAAVSTL